MKEAESSHKKSKNPAGSQANQAQKQSTSEETLHQQTTLQDLGDKVEKFATKTAASIKKAFNKALESRNFVLTIRVNDECNKKLKILTESGLFNSRSESAAFLIEEGIKQQEPLFTKISSKMEKIDKLRKELRNIAVKEIKK